MVNPSTAYLLCDCFDSALAFDVIMWVDKSANVTQKICEEKWNAN